ncbi:MAG: Flavinator of succinate dehydrogenase [Pseudomonadota bacterium]
MLLTAYLRERWPQADEAERDCFEQFLDLPDPQIAAYLVAGEDPGADPQLQALVVRLRATLQRS